MEGRKAAHQWGGGGGPHYTRHPQELGLNDAEDVFLPSDFIFLYIEWSRNVKLSLVDYVALAFNQYTYSKRFYFDVS